MPEERKNIWKQVGFNPCQDEDENRLRRPSKLTPLGLACPPAEPPSLPVLTNLLQRLHGLFRDFDCWNGLENLFLWSFYNHFKTTQQVRRKWYLPIKYFMAFSGNIDFASLATAAATAAATSMTAGAKWRHHWTANPTPFFSSRPKLLSHPNGTHLKLVSIFKKTITIQKISTNLKLGICLKRIKLGNTVLRVHPGGLNPLHPNVPIRRPLVL